MLLAACGPPTLASLSSRSLLAEPEKGTLGQGPGDLVVRLGYDARDCKGVFDPSLRATYNGRAMTVFRGHAKGWFQDPCTSPVFRIGRTPADDAAAVTTIVVSDRSMTITAEYDDFLAPRMARLGALAQLRANTVTTLDWSPPTDRYVEPNGDPASAMISFHYDGFPTDPNLRKSGDPLSWSASGRIEKGTLSFLIPAEAESGNGTLRIQVAGDRIARRCDGASRCFARPEERVVTVHAGIDGAPPPEHDVQANQIESRFDASATLVEDGRVLLAGGVRNGTHLRSAEVWDPKLARWTATAPMIDSRSGHRAIVLGGGRVLVVGGRSFDHLGDDRFCEAGRRAEIWDSATGVWSPTPCLPKGDMALDPAGPVRTPGGKILVGTVGVEQTDRSALVEYDSARDTWTEVSRFPRLDDYTLAPLADGRVARIGGSRPLTAGMPLRECAAFDPRTKRWSDLAPMLSPRRTFQAIPLADGRLMVVGGTEQTGWVLSTELFDPVANVWTAGPPLPRNLKDTVTATGLSDGRVVLLSGEQSWSWRSGDAGWSPLAKVTFRRAFYSLVPYPDGTLLIAGGSENGGISDHWRFAAPKQ